MVREALRGSEPGHAHNFTAHHLLLTTYYSLLTAHYLRHTTYGALLTAHYLQLTTHGLLLSTWVAVS